MKFAQCFSIMELPEISSHSLMDTFNIRMSTYQMSNQAHFA